MIKFEDFYMWVFSLHFATCYCGFSNIVNLSTIRFIENRPPTRKRELAGLSNEVDMCVLIESDRLQTNLKCQLTFTIWCDRQFYRLYKSIIVIRAGRH